VLGLPNQPPTISGTPATLVNVDSAYDFMPTVSDADGDVLSCSISGKPAWANFDTSTGHLWGTPGAADEGSYAGVQISVSDGTETASLPAFTITVAGLPNQPPTISGTPATQVTVGNAYNFTPTASDADGDLLSFSIAGMPGWASFDSSTGHLWGTPGATDEGSYTGIRISVSDGMDNASLSTFGITVVGLPNQPPTINGVPPTQVDVGSAYDFTPTASDPDGDSLSFSIVGIPAWASFDASSGRLWGTPGVADVGSYAGIQISVFDGTVSTTLPAFTILVDNVAGDPPTISGLPPTQVDVGEEYTFTPAADDPNDLPLTFSIVNKPSWAGFDSGDGTLSGTPGAEHIGTTTDITISVSNGSSSAALETFSITVTSGSSGGVAISSTLPDTYVWDTLGVGKDVYIDRNYTYMLIPPTFVGVQYLKTANDDKFVTASDAISFDVDKPVTVFVAYQLTALPTWLQSWIPTGAQWEASHTTFDVYRKDFPAGTVMLGGNEGGLDSMYSLAVVQQGGIGGGNPPSITGTPPTSITSGVDYSFLPTATDADGDSLTFSILGKPSWANFDPATGALTGTPGIGDVGTHSGIIISVSDGVYVASLPSFSVTVVAAATGSAILSWDAPTQNTDGSDLTDLAGYRVHYGTALGDYPNTIPIDNPATLDYEVDNLTEGTWFFTVTAYDTVGNESENSNVVSKTIEIVPGP
jgi:hypothetical protein